MARTAARQMNPRNIARCRTAMMTVILIAALASFADVRRADAQYDPMGRPLQPPYPTYAYPPAAPQREVIEPPVTRRAGRADASRRVGRLHPVRRELAPRKRTAVERRNVARSLRNVDRDQKSVRREESRNQRNVRREEIRRKPVKPVENQRETAEKSGYKRVSDLVNFPKFFPGLGIIFVKPDTLPTGPYLCFDRKDQLIATVYMVSIKDIDAHKALEAAGVSGPVDHVSFYFNAGHPGMDMPHYHFVIWHVSKKDEARVAQ